MNRAIVLILALGAQTLAAQAPPARTDSLTERRVRYLTDRRCNDCHSVVVLKIKGAGDVGPDLSSAYSDVPARYGMPLERFFDQPAGIMKVIWGGGASLRPAERDSLVALFRDLYHEQLAKSDSAEGRAHAVDTKRRS